MHLFWRSLSRRGSAQVYIRLGGVDSSLPSGTEESDGEDESPIPGRAFRQVRVRREANPPQLYDGYLFAIALSDFLRAARVAQRRGIGAPELKAAIEDAPLDAIEL